MKKPPFHTNFIFRICILLIALPVAFSSCRKDYFIPPPADLNTPVSFSEQLIPIFTSDCALSSCHVTGGPAPNLTPASAYDQLLLLGYVDSTNADGSILYIRVNSTTDPMPPDEKLPPDEINLIYAWITQGAKNN